MRTRTAPAAPERPPVEGWPAESAERAASARRPCASAASVPIPNRYDRTHGLAEIVAGHGEQSLEELERLAAGRAHRRPRDDAARPRARRRS